MPSIIPAHGRPASGADLTDLVPFIQGSEASFKKLRQVLERDADVIHADDLEVLRKLGEGGFGVVYKCKYNATADTPRSAAEILAYSGQVVAVKQLKSFAQMRLDQLAAGIPEAETSKDFDDRLHRQHADAVQEFAHEVFMLKKLKHPNVIGYVGCSVFRDKAGEEELALVLEYSEHGSLKDQIMAPRHLKSAFTVSDGMRWAHDVAKGMAFLHKCTPPIIHRDLKPGNIMLCGPKRDAKVADFGLAALELEKLKDAARKRSISVARTNFKVTGGVGSLRYMAPENFRGEHYTHTVDVYSFGIIMFELLNRGRAFESLYMPSERVATAVAEKDLRPDLPSPWPAPVKEVISACWHREPSKRPEFAAIAQTIGAWRESPDYDGMLKAIARGSKRGMLETLGIHKSV